MLCLWGLGGGTRHLVNATCLLWVPAYNFGRTFWIVVSDMEVLRTVMFPVGTRVVFIHFAGEPLLAQAVRYSERDDARGRIAYQRDGKPVLHMYTVSFCRVFALQPAAPMLRLVRLFSQPGRRVSGMFLFCRQSNTWQLAKPLKVIGMGAQKLTYLNYTQITIDMATVHDLGIAVEWALVGEVWCHEFSNHFLHKGKTRCLRCRAAKIENNSLQFNIL